VLDAITGLGATLVAISPQRPEHNRELVRSRGLGFYAGFPLDIPAYNGDASWTLPMPARFVIDTRGIIRYADSDPDYTTRPEPEDTLAALRALRSR
jgi:peroxiredoxin